jgi:hypothetical protein
VPLYTTQTDTSSTLLGVLAFDYELDDIETILANNKVDNVVQYIVTASDELVATSVGEIKTTSTGDIKLATSADNFIIRESSAMLATNLMDGYCYYTSSVDDADYIMKVTTFTEGASLVWKIIMVTEVDHVPEMSIKAAVVLADLDAALDDLTQNTISVTSYIEFMANKNAAAPLSTAIVEDSSTASLSSVTHQALWGVMNCFHEVGDIMVSYANKKMFHFHADNTRMFFRDSGDAATYDEYLINTDGSITGHGGIVSSSVFDPTAQAYYMVATETAAWSPFFADPSDTVEPEIAFSRPFFSSPYVLDGVISTTIFLQDFTNVLTAFVDPAVVYFILEEDDKLVATSTGEATWDATAETLKTGNTSSSELVSFATQYIVDNAITVDNTFILQNKKFNAEDMIVTVKTYTDALNLLKWRVVSAQYYDEDEWTGSSSAGDDDEAAAATGAAIALGSLLFITLAVSVGLVAAGKLTLGAGGKDGDTASLSKNADSSSSKL